MPFNYSSGIITQTGTDTSLSGLSGLTGVTVYDSLYVLDNVFLRVEGTLSFNGYTERIVFVNPDDSGTGLNYMSIYVDDGASLSIACDNGIAFSGFVQTNALLPCIDFGTRAIAGPGGATNYNGGRKFFSVHPSGSIALTGVFVGENSNSQGIISSFDGTSELVDCIMMTKTALSNVQYSFKGTVLIRRTTLLGAVLADRGATYTFDGFTVGEATEGFLFGGAAVSNTHTTVVDFATYNTSFQDIRINMSGTTGYGTVILLDAQKEANNMTVSMADNDGFNFCVWQSNLTLNFLDTDLNATDVKVYAQDVNNGSRFGTIVVSGGTDISDATKTYQGATTSGSISFQPYSAFSRKVLGVYTIDNRGNSNGSNITYYFYEYGKLVGNVTPTLVGNGFKTATSTVLPDANVAEANKTIVDAYTEIDTSNKLYDRAAAYLEDNLGTYTEFILSKSGVLIDAGAYNVTIDATASSVFEISGNTITIKASTFTGDMTTTGVITLVNGATFNGTRTDANGTVLPLRNISVTGLSAGSRLCVYNQNTSTQVFNQVVAGTSYTAQYAEGVGYSIGDVLELKVAKINMLEFSTSVVVTSTGWNGLISQEANAIYNAHGVDGSTVAGISWDSGNLEFDFNDSDNNIDGADIGAWYYYFITTEIGIAEAFGALVWSQINKITNATSKVAITFDNIKSLPLQINNCWIDREDGVSIISPTSNSIQINPPAVFDTSNDDVASIKAKTDLLNFTGTDVKATLDGEDVVTDTASRNASKATTTVSSNMRGTDGANTVTPITPPTVTEIRAGFVANDFKATTTVASNMRGTDGANTVVPDNSSVTDVLTGVEELLVNQNIINEGVEKASLFIPHKTNVNP